MATRLLRTLSASHLANHGFAFSNWANARQRMAGDHQRRGRRLRRACSRKLAHAARDLASRTAGRHRAAQGTVRGGDRSAGVPRRCATRRAWQQSGPSTSRRRTRQMSSKFRLTPRRAESCRRRASLQTEKGPSRSKDEALTEAFEGEAAEITQSRGPLKLRMASLKLTAKVRHETLPDCRQHRPHFASSSALSDVFCCRHFALFARCRR